MKNTYPNHINKNKASALITALFTALWCAGVLLSLSACGQRGSLYIPNTPEAAQRSTIGDVLTQPSSPATSTTPAPATQTPPAPAK